MCMYFVYLSFCLNIYLSICLSLSNHLFIFPHRSSSNINHLVFWSFFFSSSNSATQNGFPNKYRCGGQRWWRCVFHYTTKLPMKAKLSFRLWSTVVWRHLYELLCLSVCPIRRLARSLRITLYVCLPDKRVSSLNASWTLFFQNSYLP